MKKNTWIIVLICLIGLLILFGIPFTNRQVENDFKHFNEAKLSGLIEYVKIKHHGDCFKLQNDPSEFVFYPYTAVNQSSVIVFANIAGKGDQVFKAPNSDTLVLTKSGKAYFFVFKQAN